MGVFNTVKCGEQKYRHMLGDTKKFCQSIGMSVIVVIFHGDMYVYKKKINSG